MDHFRLNWGAAAVPAATAFSRPRFIDVQSPAIEFPPVECSDGFVALTVIAHFDKGEPLGPSGLAIGYQVYSVNGAIFLKERSNCIFASSEAEVS